MTSKIVRFGAVDTRTGDHGYAGWNTGYRLCGGGSHWSVEVPEGAFADRPITCKVVGTCDGTCAGGEPVWAEGLSEAVQRELGIKVPVSEDHVLVTTWSSGSKSWDPWGYRTYEAGSMVPPTMLREGTLLEPGQSAEFDRSVVRGGTQANHRELVVNDGGTPRVEEAPSVVEARKEFAREQVNWLVDLGFPQDRAARIMRAAGPGQVRAAVEWAYEARDALAVNGEVGAVEDALDAVLSGTGGTNGFGKDRMAAALQALGLPAPVCRTSRTFFGVLAGAKETLLAGLPERERVGAEAS